MARSLPVMLSFFARLINLGAIGKVVKQAVKKVHTRLRKAMNKAINYVAKKIRKLFGKKARKGSGKGGKFTAKDKRKGVHAFKQEEKKYLEQNTINKENAGTVAQTVKRKHPVFKSISVIDGKDSWDYKYILKRQKILFQKTTNAQIDSGESPLCN